MADRLTSQTMPNKINPVYRAIFIPEAINPVRAMPDKIVCPPSSNPVYPAIKVPEAIKPGRAISYARQNCTPT